MQFHFIHCIFPYCTVRATKLTRRASRLVDQMVDAQTEVSLFHHSLLFVLHTPTVPDSPSNKTTFFSLTKQRISTPSESPRPKKGQKFSNMKLIKKFICTDSSAHSVAGANFFHNPIFFPGKKVTSQMYKAPGSTVQ
jgi:hypothetical protein